MILISVLAIIDTLVGIAALMLGDKYPKLKVLLGTIFIVIVVISICISVGAWYFTQRVPPPVTVTPAKSPEAAIPSAIPQTATLDIALESAVEKWVCTGDSVRQDSTHVTVEYTGSCHIVLREGDILLGTAEKFQEDVDAPNGSVPCSAFAINGPVEVDVRMFWGGWDYYSNLEQEVIDNILVEKVNECKQNHPTYGVQTVIIP